ncbi:MAG: hypothetical protein LBG17_04525 [Bacteroidales bacterium]|nr:hypothetical protein [Bacteroidales bacterium]
MIKYLRFEFIRNRTSYITLAAIMGGIYFLYLMFYNFVYHLAETQIIHEIGTKISVQPLDINSLYAPFAILLFVSPFMLYNRLFNPVQGVSLTMLPVGQAEKFAVLLLQCVVVIPLGLTAVPTLLNIIVSLAGGVPLTGLWTSVGSFFSDLTTAAIPFQAVAIWGVLFFRRRKLWKTILTLLCITVGLSIAASITTYIYFSKQSVQPADFDLMNLLPEKSTVMFAVTVLLWAWGYLKMRRQQF